MEERWRRCGGGVVVETELASIAVEIFHTNHNAVEVEILCCLCVVTTVILEFSSAVHQVNHLSCELEVEGRG